MTSTPDAPLPLHQVLARCALDLGPIPKGDRMSARGQDSYNYRGIESILKKATPLLATYGVVITPEVQERHLEHMERGKQGNLWRLVTLLVRYTFTGPAGDQLQVVTCGEGLDNGDKAANKAMTAALKQALTQVLLIADAQEDPDHASSASQEDTTSARRAPGHSQVPPAPRTAEEETIRALIADLTPEERREFQGMFTTRWGSGLSALDTAHHADALTWAWDTLPGIVGTADAATATGDQQ